MAMSQPKGILKKAADKHESKGNLKVLKTYSISGWF
jgi:hypothetical protein